jgi:hypothetical protein
MSFIEGVGIGLVVGGMIGFAVLAFISFSDWP